MGNEREEINKFLNNHPRMLLNDVDSFVFLRTNESRKIKGLGLGGGNFLSLLGHFAVLNLLAKVYKILTSGNRPRRRCNDNKNTFTEIDAFVNLVQNYPKDLGL